MSFVRKDATRRKSPEQCAREILDVALERGLDDFAAVLGTMAVAQESDFWCPWNRKDPSSNNYAHDSESNDGRSVAYLQQQNGRAGEELPIGDRDNWWGPMSSRMDLKKSMNQFLSRLQDNYRDAIESPSLASEFISNVQRPRPDLRGEYAKHWDRAWKLVNNAKTMPPGNVPENNEGVPMVSGDPVWLEDVLRPALGDRLRTFPGWQTDGVGGTMREIWGIVWHHTGNINETPEGISRGRSDLSGPLAQILIAKDGTVTIVAVGPCNHAGKGSWVGLPTDDANDRTIGIECAYPRDVNNPQERWPDAQIISMRDVGAALTQHLDVPVSHNISHYEWAQRGPAGVRQGKTDPWNLDMNWFRGEIAKDIAGQFDTKPPVIPPVVIPPVLPPPVEPPPDVPPTTPPVWMQPQLTDPLMGPTAEIKKLQHRMLYAYPANSRAFEEGVTESGMFDAATDRALRNLQPHLTPPQPASGVLTYATKLATGVIVEQPKEDKKRFVQQGWGFSTDAFLMGDPNHSYINACDEGSTEGLRLALPLVGVPKVGFAYSMGGDVLKQALQRWPADRRDEWKLLAVFGNPSRRPGPTLLGNDPGGSGISGSWYPEWTWPILYDFTHEGDMYPNAVGVLPQIYQILIRLEMSTEFAMYLFQMLMSSFGPILLGTVGSMLPGAGALAPILGMVTEGPKTDTSGPPNLLAMIMNIGGIIQALAAALKFISTNAHFHYHDQPETFWRGLTAVDCAAQITAEKVPGGIAYTVPGTVSWWNDGPPAWTAWKLP